MATAEFGRKTERELVLLGVMWCVVEALVGGSCVDECSVSEELAFGGCNRARNCEEWMWRCASLLNVHLTLGDELGDEEMGEAQDRLAYCAALRKFR